MNQIVFSDVDGTLLNDKHEITPLTKKAIQELKIKNIPFVIVSARSPSGILSIFKKYDIQGTIIAYSGALIMDDQEHIIYSQSMEVQYAIDMIKYIEKDHLDLSWCVYSYDQWLVKDCQDPRIKNEENIVEVKSHQITINQLSQLSAIHKILCICNPQETLSIKQKLKERFPHCTISQSSNCLIEIMDCDVHKGLAVKKLCELWKVPLANTIAFGDQYNDLEMLKTVKYGFVMENAPVDIQRQVNNKTLDNNHDGIYHALVKLNIIHQVETRGETK